MKKHALNWLKGRVSYFKLVSIYLAILISLTFVVSASVSADVSYSNNDHPQLSRYGNIAEYGPGEGTAITAGEMAVGGAVGAAAGKVVGKTAGWAAKKAGNAAGNVFTSAEKMIASKSGSLNPGGSFESGSAKQLFNGATKKDALAFARGENLPESVRASAKTFFQGATGKSDQFHVFKTDKGFKFEFFSKAKNQGYGKNYIQDVDDYGKKINEYKETIGPSGVIDREYLTKDYGGIK